MYACPVAMSDSLHALESLLLQFEAGRDDTARQLVAFHCEALQADAPEEFSEQIGQLRRLATLYFGHHFRSHRSLQARDIRMRALVCCVSIRYGMSATNLTDPKNPCAPQARTALATLEACPSCTHAKESRR